MQRYLNVLYATIVWTAVLLLIKRRRIKELFPVAILSAGVIALQETFLISLHLHVFNNPFIPINNVPLFHFIFAAGSGLFMMNYMKREPNKKVFVILIFAAIITSFAFISNKIGCCSLLGKFTIIHNFYQNFLVLCFLTIISEAFLYKKIYTD